MKPKNARKTNAQDTKPRAKAVNQGYGPLPWPKRQEDLRVGDHGIIAGAHSRLGMVPIPVTILSRRGEIVTVVTAPMIMEKRVDMHIAYVMPITRENFEVYAPLGPEIVSEVLALTNPALTRLHLSMGFYFDEDERGRWYATARAVSEQALDISVVRIPSGGAS